jgi:hypothetical protein
MYEASLPSWTVILAQYSPLYHPWMRHLVKLISFLASCITMAIGFYDLYMHFPVFRNFLNAHFHSWVQWLEEIIYIRMTILAGYIFYFPFQSSLDLLIGSENLLMLVGWVLWFFNTLFYPVFYLLWLIKSSIVICYELLLPIFALIRILVMTTWNLIWTVLNLPFVSLSFLFTSAYEGLASLFALGTGLNQGAQQVRAIVSPLT